MLNQELIIPGDAEATLKYCAEHFIQAAKRAISAKGRFFLALSGGSTPKILYERLFHSPLKERVDWQCVDVFFADEREVPPDHCESNYMMIMDAGLKDLACRVHRMQAEAEIEKGALLYEEEIRSTLRGQPFDLILLGMGEDGHTASLFPYTSALHEEERLVVANFVPQKNCYRMTLTFPCLNQAKQCILYVLGNNKKEMLSEVLHSPPDFNHLPVQHIGTDVRKALWVVDQAAASLLRE